MVKTSSENPLCERVKFTVSRFLNLFYTINYNSIKKIILSTVHPLILMYIIIVYQKLLDKIHLSYYEYYLKNIVRKEIVCRMVWGGGCYDINNFIGESIGVFKGPSSVV